MRFGLKAIAGSNMYWLVSGSMHWKVFIAFACMVINGFTKIKGRQISGFY